MGSDNKTKILIMAGVLSLAIVLAVVFFLRGNGDNTTPPNNPPGNMAGRPGTPAGMPTQMGRPAGNPGAPGVPSGTRPAMAGMAAGAAAPAEPMLKPPPAPSIAAMVQLSTAGMKDPFAGFPPPPPPQKQVPYPQVVPVSSVPPVMPVRSKGNPITLTTTIIPKEAPIGRLAGWIFNNNGQIVAIFEDADGITRTVRVGDQVGGYTVQSITPDMLVMVDDKGAVQKLKLQGLDTYQGKSRMVNIDAVPTTAAPAWGAGQ